MARIPDYWVSDESLAPTGRLMIEWAEKHMPVLLKIRERLAREKPLTDQRIGACLHITKETAVLARTLIAAGAQLSLCASNPLSTQDEVAAALSSEGVGVYGFRGESSDDYYKCIGYALGLKPTITMDDGADLVSTLHKLSHGDKSKEMNVVKKVLGGLAGAEELISNVVGGSEETTTGVTRLRSMAEKGLLKYPIVAVNDAKSKSLFDNPIGTGQSALDGIIRATNVLVAGKNFIVAGYGQVGSGIAERARGLGAKVTVVEPNPIRALRATMFGFSVDSMNEAAEYGDVFITATGNVDVIRREHMKKMKDGVILANAGHFDVEISKADLEKLATKKERTFPRVEKYTLKDGRELFLLAEGRLVNLACAEGHPSEVMDLSFSLQALCAEYISENGKKLSVSVLDVPAEMDEEVARLKLDTMGIRLEELTSKQRSYLSAWELGTE